MQVGGEMRGRWRDGLQGARLVGGVWDARGDTHRRRRCPSRLPASTQHGLPATHRAPPAAVRRTSSEAR